MKRRNKEEHLFGPGPKRILALDGGGVRGTLTLSYLRQIEKILRQRYGNDFRLCDYFDLIGGTSTGAIIAAGLALGFEVEKLQELYVQLSSEIFKKQFWRVGLIGSKFPHEPLVRVLQTYFGDITLGDDQLRTGLVVVAKRLDTGSPWIMHNNPRGIFYKTSAIDSDFIPNREFLLRQVVRASTAAPHYFEPEKVQIADGIEAAFVDGGVSPFNNPSLQLLFVANIRGFGLGWALGADQLLLVSVGTGSAVPHFLPNEIMKMSAAMLSLRALSSMMEDCEWLTQTLLQWMSNSPTAWEIDSEIGDLRSDQIGNQELLSYLRYNVHLDSDWIKENLMLEMNQRQAAALIELDEPRNVDNLRALGDRAASLQVADSHFRPCFDLA